MCFQEMNITAEKIHEQKDIDVSSFEYKEKPVFDIVKRLFDIVVSSIGILLLAIPFLIVSLGI